MRTNDGRRFRRDRTDGPTAADTADLIDRMVLMQERRGLKPSTIKSRVDKLVLLAEYLYPRGLLEATREDLETFLDGRSLGDRARYAYVSHFGCFYEAMIDDEKAIANPAERIHRPRQRTGLPRPIADPDLRIALAAASPRMKAMLSLGAFAGLRAKEIAGLCRQEVLESNDPPVLYVLHGKGDKERVVPLNQQLASALSRCGMPGRGPIFRRDDEQMKPWQVSHDVNGFLHGLGIDATCHQLRHWFGTKLYQATGDLLMVQALMGHSSPTSTAIYAAFSPDGAHGAVDGLMLD